MKSLLVAGAALPAVALAAALAKVVPFDVAISSISVMFIAALVPGVVENHRRKVGWSKQSTVMTSAGLLSMGMMFVSVGLPFTGALTLLSGMMWAILAVQAFVYGRSHIARTDARVLYVDELKNLLEKHGHGEFHNEEMEGCENCALRRVMLETMK